MPSSRGPSVAATGATGATFPEFVWIWNRRQGLGTPNIHLRMSRWLHERWIGGDRELVLLAFRSSGKSTLTGLFCSWLLLQNPDLRILVLAGDFALAKKMVRNVRRLIEAHPLTRPLGGDFDYWQLGLVFESYHPVRDEWVVAWRFKGSTVGDDAPFYALPFIDLRGIPAMRYQGDDVMQLDTEVRWDFVPRWSLVGFIGGGQTWNAVELRETNEQIIAGGVGFRYLLARKLQMRCGIDVAYVVTISDGEPRVSRLGGADAFGQLMNAQTFANGQVPDDLAFSRLSDIAERVSVYRLETGADPDGLGQWLIDNCGSHAAAL